MKVKGRILDGWYLTSGGGTYAPDPGLNGSVTAPYVLMDSAWGTDPSANNSGNVGPGTCGTAGLDDGMCAYGQPAVAAQGSAPIFGTARVGSERAQGFRQIDASLEKSWKLHESHELVFTANGYNVANVTSYNNQGRTTGGGSKWGYVQSTRSEPRQLELELKYQF
jgi:hypothetical protein